MRRPCLIVATQVLLTAIACASAAAASGPLTCALVDVYDCSASECTETTSEAVGVPDLLRVDRDKKTIEALDPEFAHATSTIESVKSEDGTTAVRAREGDRTLVLIADDASGDATLVAGDLKTTIVAYGECGR